MSEQCPPGTQENYNSFSSKNPVTEKGKEFEYRRVGGGKRESEYPEGAGGGKGEPGVPPIMGDLIRSFTTKYGEISCYLNDVVFAAHLSKGEIYEEHLITNYIVPLLNSDNSEKLILDIGGHIGSHSLLYSQLINNCKILTFEPQRKIYEILKHNIKVNDISNCKIHNNAVGHTNMQTNLSNMLYDGYNCAVEYDTEKILNYGGIGLGQNGEKVDMISVDSLELNKCDYMKIDVEGAEILVLMGAKETIVKFKPLILFEHTDKCVSSEMKNSMGIDFELPNVIDYLHKLGYSFYKLNTENILAYHFANTRKINIDLSTQEKTVFSESGEDGVLFALFNAFGVTDKYFVEFGAENGTQCNTRALREHAGFNGILFDMDFENPEINLFKHTITEDSVVRIFQQHAVPRQFDLLSVDIDSHDFYVLHEILKSYTPRILVCEYNATHLPNEDRVVLRGDMNFNGNYFGASILAFYKLAIRFNYSLVYANEKGVNLFFVRNDLLAQSIFTVKNINNVKMIYRTPKYGKGPNGGHEEDIYGQLYTSADELL